MFHAAPAKADETYGKPAMYRTELSLTENSELNIDGDPKTYKGVAAIKEALAPLRVAVESKTGVDRNGAPWERLNSLKFQSKVLEPGDAVKNKPIVVDAKGHPFPDNGPLIGNGSVVVVKGSLPDYRVNPVAAGRRPMLPKFEGVQVLELVEYVRSSTAGFVPREGYTVGSLPAQVVHEEPRSDHQDDEQDDIDGLFASLENPKDLEPATVVTTASRVKRKA